MRKTMTIVAAAMGFIASRSFAAEEMNLIMTTISLPNTPAAQIYHEWADKVNAAGKGAVHLDVRDGFTLVNSANFYDRLLSDVVQVTFGSPNYLGGQFRLSQVMALPFVFTSSEQASVVYWRLYKSGLLDAEFEKVVPMFLQGFPQSSLHLVKAPATVLLDLKGLRLIVGGQTATRVMTSLGATPISVALTDSYEALQRGTADGMSFPMAATHDFKLDEVTHYHIVAALGGGPGGVWMAKAKYMSLPSEVRRILDENSGEAASRRSGYLLDQQQVDVPKKIQAMQNQAVTQLTAQQSELWQKAVAPVFDSWDEADKPRSDAVLAKVRALAAEVQSGR